MMLKEGDRVYCRLERYPQSPLNGRYAVIIGGDGNGWLDIEMEDTGEKFSMVHESEVTRA